MILVELSNIAVTPFAGVWIEITTETTIKKLTESLPSRECGLKY